MSRYRLTPAAQGDLASIWDLERWDVRQVEIYVNEIRPAIERIAADPRRGHSCEDIRTGYRRYGIGSHHIF